MSVLVIYCCLTNYSEDIQLKTRHAYYLKVSVDQESGSTFLGVCLMITHKPVTKVPVGQQS